MQPACHMHAHFAEPAKVQDRPAPPALVRVDAALQLWYLYRRSHDHMDGSLQTALASEA